MFKDFTKDFEKLKEMIQQGNNFAFTRYSDGELFMMQNKTIVLADNHYITGDIKGRNIYTKEEHKEFHPEKHQFYREKLIDTFLHNQENYFKGICTSSDGHVGKENFDWMIDFHGGDHQNLTFANLLINANYQRFVEEIIPLLSGREIIYVVNEMADTTKLPFDISKRFNIGSNCVVNNYDTAEKVKNYIQNNKTENAVILCSAASLSNYVIYECFKDNDKNTFLDIGSCLNPLLSLEGWKYTRGYLTSYWLGHANHYGKQKDIWG